jgi:hypothetical protein
MELETIDNSNSFIKMKFFNVTNIEFDFDSDDDVKPDKNYREMITKGAIGVWECVDEELLTDTISNSTGWCINSIKYDKVNF